MDVCQPTLSRWLRDRSLGGMTEEKGPRKGARPASEKLRIVLEAASLSDEDLGKLLRLEGIHKADLETWRTAVMQGLAPPKRKSSKKSPNQIVPKLADCGEYIASESPLYRVLRAERLLEPRGKAR